MEEIKSRAFFDAGLESFAAPPLLKKVGAMAFKQCRKLKDF